MKAIWNGTVVAESDDTLVVDGNHYFPEAALERRYVVGSNHRSRDSGKGEARYYSLLVDGDLHPDAIWTYPEPLEGAEALAGRVAFGRGVRIV